MVFQKRSGFLLWSDESLSATSLSLSAIGASRFMEDAAKQRSQLKLKLVALKLIEERVLNFNFNFDPKITLT